MKDLTAPRLSVSRNASKAWYWVDWNHVAGSRRPRAEPGVDL